MTRAINNLIKLSLLATVLALGTLHAGAAVINGMLVDAVDSLGLAQATVRLYRVAGTDSTMVAGTTTDANGVFDLKGVKAGRYTLKCTYVGYSEANRHVTVGRDGRDVNMGVIAMASGVMLQEMVVTGVKTPITVKEDTIEYNADTYKTQANAVVEDLLKRLPGVEVGSDGKITANGKSVTKILIDGKEFFSDDPTVASKNIPADMVDKLQVVDRRSDLARLTGVDDGEDETVINLTVKKGMNNGWFGTVNAGYGTDDRYTGNVIANYFNSGNRFTLMGGGNNTNNLGFTDGGASRFRRFGGSDGITTSQNLGFNFNVGSSDDEKFRAGGDVMYSHSDRDTRSTTARQYLLQDSTSYYNSASTSRDKGHNLRGDFRIKWQPDSVHTLEFRPNFSVNWSDSYKTDSTTMRAGDAARSLVNRSLSSYQNSGTSYEFGGQVVYSHNIKSHPGRSYSAQLRYNYSNVTEDGNTYTSNNYYQLTDRDEVIDQVTQDSRRTNGVRGRLTWTEPLGNIKNARFLTLAYRANYQRSRATKSTWDITRASTTPAPALAPLTANEQMAWLLGNQAFTQYVASNYGSYALIDATLLAPIIASELGDEIGRTFNEDQSNRFRNTYFNQGFEVGFRQVRKAYNLNVGLSLNSAMSKSTDLLNAARNIPSHWVWSVAPFARMRYKFSKTRNLSLDYRMRANSPSLTQLQPVADRSNPLNIVVGNPELKPTFTHRFNVRFSDFDQQSQRSIMTMTMVNFSQNSIVSNTTFDSQTGGRTTTYGNVNGVWEAMQAGMVSFPFTNSKIMHFTSNFFARYSHSQAYNNGQLNTSSNFMVTLAPGIALRNSILDLELRPRYNLNTTHNSLAGTSNATVHSYGGMFNGTVSLPMGLVMSTDLSYSTTSGYSSGYNTSQWIWNASLSYQFLRDKAASVQVSVFDILQQKKAINRNVTANYVDDVFTNSLTRYGMLTFTYRFTTFKKGEQPRDMNEERRWGPPGEGRRGGGGPPPGGGGRRPF